MTHKLSTITLSFLAFFLIFPLASSVIAQSSLTAIPPKYELTLNPGQSETIQLKLKNDTEVVENYTIAVTNFIVTDDSGTPIPITDETNNRFALSSWITAPDFMPVDPGVTSPIVITVTAPNDALPGGHYAMITYQPRKGLAKTDLAESGSIIGQRTGTLLYVTIPGEITEKALITKLNAPQFSEYGPIPVDLTIENASDIHIRPQGQLTTTDMINNQVSSIPLSEHNIFPSRSKDYNFSIGSKWMLGRYQAVVDAAYGTTGQSVTGTIYFWVFPWKLALAIFGIIFAIILLISYIRHRQKGRKDEITQLKETLEKVDKTTKTPPTT